MTVTGANSATATVTDTRRWDPATGAVHSTASGTDQIAITT